MKAGTLNVKLVIRKLQGSKQAFQFMLLAGFTSQITHATAVYTETLSPNSVLKPQEIDNIVAKLVAHSNAASSKFITNPDVQKKLDKLFEVPEAAGLTDCDVFANLGIGSYL